MSVNWLELHGFSAGRGRFLLTVPRTTTGSSNNSEDLCSGDALAIRVLERDLVDLQRLDRQLRNRGPSGLQRLPTKRLRKLMSSNWVRGDRASGWRIELQKNVSVCEDWLNTAVVHLPSALQQEFLDDDLYTATKRKWASERAESKHARDMQQYFSSAELVDLVVKTVMMHLNVEQQREVVWLEPSCGDGRFLTTLLRARAQHVVGYEIDEKLHVVAKKNVQQAAFDVSSVDKVSTVQAHVCVEDFLASKSHVPADKFVVAVGNPPFGAKGGDGSDRVHQFFRHAARTWRARIIAFIVPERCSRREFVENTLKQLEDLDGAAGAWTLATELALTGFQFEFGTGAKLKRVRQPSVLQLFVRSDL